MFGKLAVKLALSALKRADLSTENRALLTTAILDRLVALPIRDIIRINEEGHLLVNDRVVDLETARLLRESARSILNSPALKLVHDQVLYAAITVGVHKLENERQSFFSRAAIWYGQHEIEVLKLLAYYGDQREPHPTEDYS